MKHYHIKHKMLLICGLLYTFCLFGTLGISSQIETWSGQMESKEEEQLKEAVSYVSSNMIIEPPKIAITFDDGPNALFTPKLLDGLKQRGVKATFFLIGKNAEKNTDIIKRMQEEGHLIGNHTYNHVEITKLSDEAAFEEIRHTSAVIGAVTGERVEFVRPPFGLWQRELELGLEVIPVMWTIDPLDWTTENTDEIVNKVVTQAGEDDIILLHDCYSSSVDAALRIVDVLQENGFEFVTVDQLVMK